MFVFYADGPKTLGGDRSTEPLDRLAEQVVFNESLPAVAQLPITAANKVVVLLDVLLLLQRFVRSGV